MPINFTNLSLVKKTIDQHVNSRLLIVSKNQSYNDVKLLINEGFELFGENRVQEAFHKYNELIFNDLKPIELHLIGPLQTNKVKTALSIFDTIQTLDRKKLAKSISDNLNKTKNRRTKNFFIQVNIGNEIQKSGISTYELSGLYDYASELGLNIVGLMCIPPNDLEPEKYFEKMAKIRDGLGKNLKLSMGMSGDYEMALKFGSNIIRVGSKIFK